MAEPDRIHIRDLLLRCIVGVNAEERREKQDVVVNATLEADLRQPCRSDDLAHTLDYKAVTKQIIATVESSSCFLLEHLAQRIADACLQEPRVRRVRVAVDKPAALRFTRSVAVEIVRDRPPDAPSHAR
ncbi:MAG: dihydroneopterin aldolase [Candidatus Brocadiia bacterium]